MSIRLENGAGERIATRHDKASSTINSAGSTAPGAVDGGVATAQLLAIVAAVTGTAHDIAVVEGVLGGRVRDAAANIVATDAEVAESFRPVGDS